MKTITIKGQARTQKIAIHFKDKYEVYYGKTCLGEVWARDWQEADQEAHKLFKRSRVHVREVR